MTAFDEREDTAKQCSHHNSFNKLQLIKLIQMNIIYLHTESFQEIQEIQRHLMLLERRIKCEDL